MTAVPSLLAPSPSSALAVGKPAKPAAGGFALILADTTPVDVAATPAAGSVPPAAGATGVAVPDVDLADTPPGDDIDPALLIPGVQPEPGPAPAATTPGAAPPIPLPPSTDRHDDAADGKPLPPADRMAALRARLLASATPAPDPSTDDGATPAKETADDAAKDDETTSSSLVASPEATPVPPVVIVPTEAIPPVVIPTIDAVPPPVATAVSKAGNTAPPAGQIAKAVAGATIAGPAATAPATPPPPATPPLSVAPAAPPVRIVGGTALQALAGGDASVAPVTGQPPTALPLPLPRETAAMAKGDEPARPLAVNGTPAAMPPAAALPVPPAIPSASPIAIGATAPAGQAFAAAIEAADRQDRLAADRGADASAAAVAPVAGTVPVAAAGGAGTDQPSLDMRQQGWPAAMVDHIEKLRDAADATSTRIRVVPDALGSIDVTVRRHDDGAVQVSLAADRPATQAMIADARPELTRLAGERGTRLDVSVGGGAGGNAFGAGSGAPDGRAQPQVATRRAPAPAPTPSDDPADAAEGRVA